MSKYDRLGSYLRQSGMSQVPMTFAEIERVTGTKLPKSQEYQAWWSNSTSNNVMTQVWLDAGYRTEQVDTVARKLVFKRIAAPRPTGMEEGQRMFEPAEAKKVGRHPLIGAMKGTFTIEPGWDLTKPALDPEELAEWEANLDRKADMIAQGLSGKK
jgi:hypothetical protein